jgi:hypothetical protein
MALPVDLSQSHEFRDAAGQVVGYYLPAHEFAAQYSPANGREEATPTQARPSSPDATLAEECRHLRAELERVRAERDVYRKSVCALMREPPTFTREEVFRSLGQEPALDQVIRELELAQERSHG